MKTVPLFYLILPCWLALSACGLSQREQVTSTSQTETAVPPLWTATPYPSEITDARGIPMRLVPADEFTMGSDAENALAECKKFKSDCQLDWFKDEEPPHSVYLDAFYMDSYEVTNAAYKACVDAGGCTPPTNTASQSRSSYYGNSQFDNYPVIYVDWNQAQTYCEWRGGSLPTEAQWEKAARGTDGRAYPWGNTFDGTKVNFCDKNCPLDSADNTGDDGYADTSPVGSYESGKSPYGIYDLAGNVWEWTADWYDAYPGNTVSNSDYETKYHVMRGGSWSDGYVSFLRASKRIGVSPDYFSYVSVGFRCARSP